MEVKEALNAMFLNVKLTSKDQSQMKPLLDIAFVIPI